MIGLAFVVMASALPTQPPCAMRDTNTMSLLLLLLFTILATTHATSLSIVSPQSGAVIDYGANFTLLIDSTPPANNISAYFFFPNDTIASYDLSSGVSYNVSLLPTQYSTCILFAGVDISRLDIVGFTILGPTVLGTTNLTVPEGSESVLAGENGTVLLETDDITMSELPVLILLTCPPFQLSESIAPSNGTSLVPIPVTSAGRCLYVGYSLEGYYVLGAPYVNVSSPLTLLTPVSNAVLTASQSTTVYVNATAAFLPTARVTLVLTCANQTYSQEILVRIEQQFIIPSYFTGTCVFTTLDADFYVAIIPVTVTVSNIDIIIARFNYASFLSGNVHFSDSK